MLHLQVFFCFLRRLLSQFSSLIFNSVVWALFLTFLPSYRYWAAGSLCNNVENLRLERETYPCEAKKRRKKERKKVIESKATCRRYHVILESVLQSRIHPKRSCFVCSRCLTFGSDSPKTELFLSGSGYTSDNSDYN